MFALLKLILNGFSGEPKLPLIPKVGPSPNIKKLFLRLSQHEMTSYYQQQKLKHFKHFLDKHLNDRQSKHLQFC